MPSSPLNPVRPSTLRLAFAPDFVSARDVSGAIRGFLAEQGLPEKELFSYELCVTEACINAIEYAAGEARHLEPVAEVLFTSEQIELRVTDHTAGFVMPERIPPPSPMLERGRGLFLIQSIMDQVLYLRGSGENTLVMRKKRHSPHLFPSPGDSGPDLMLQPEESQRQLTETKRTLAIVAGELSVRSEVLSAIFRCCAELGRSDQTADEFGERLISDLLHITSSDWCILRLLSPDSRQLAVAAVSEPGLSTDAIELPTSGERPRGLEALAAVDKKPARYNASNLPDGDPLTGIGPECTGLVCPLCFGGELVGTIAVGRRDGQFPLGRLQDEVIRTFAEFLAIRTLNIRHRNEEVRKRVVAHELEVAQEIQQLLLPRTLPQVPGFGLAGGWQSARGVGGDFYDAIALGGQSLFLMIADVMGKGVPAALFATTMRGLLRGLASRSSDPAQILTSLNRLMYKELSAVNMFITAQIVHVDLQDRRATIASAGHCPLIMMQNTSRAVSALTAHGVPIGVLPDTVYQYVTNAPGIPTTLLLHTDGLTDTRNSEGKMFGQRRLMAWLRANVIPGRSVNDLRDLLIEELRGFRGDVPMTDDQAFLLLSDDGDGSSPVPGAGRRRIASQRGSFLFPSHK